MRAKESILEDIASTEARLRELNQELQASDHEEQYRSLPQEPSVNHEDNVPDATGRWPFPAADYKRYGRQMIMPEIGLQGQLKLRHSSILIIGLGGLGCPAASYLAGAGISRLGLVDGDTVELSNLHRQILHTTARIGTAKVHSAVAALRQSNPNVIYEPYAQHLTPQTALDLFALYDLILDCTDHPTSRYLISDAAVLAAKPLVSASALKTDGQLIVLNYPPTPPPSSGHDGAEAPTAISSPHPGGPCYRCVFPRPPPPDSVVSCGEGGILGPVVGTMGVLMALEALKVLTAKSPPEPGAPVGLLLFSAYGSPMFRTARMKGKRAECSACGSVRTVTEESLRSGSLDYVAFCGVTNPVKVLAEEERITARALVRARDGLGLDFDGNLEMDGRRDGYGFRAGTGKMPTIIDVRDRTQFELASLPGSINIPFSRFESGHLHTAGWQRSMEGDRKDEKGTAIIPYDGSPLVFVCRLGNDSQMAAQKMKLWGYGDDGRWIGDLKGGLRAWRNEVEPDWPDF